MWLLGRDAAQPTMLVAEMGARAPSIDRGLMARLEEQIGRGNAKQEVQDAQTVASSRLGL